MNFSTRPIRNTGLSIPALGLGGAAFANLYRPISDQEAYDTVRLALDNGVRFFDTAPHYGQGVGEERLGVALAGIPREDYVLSTKVGKLVSAERTLIFDYSRDGVVRSLEASLKRLNLDHVDILLIHDADDHYQQAIDEAYPALHDLRAQGVVKAIGAGMNQWEMLLKFAQNGDFDCFLMAGRYTLLEQHSLDALAYFQQKNIAVFGAGVYNSGILATGAKDGAKFNYLDAPADVIERTRRLEALCEQHSVPLKAAALQFVGAHPAITTLLVGAETAAQFRETLDMLRTNIPAAFWAGLRAAGLVDERAPLPGGV